MSKNVFWKENGHLIDGKKIKYVQNIHMIHNLTFNDEGILYIIHKKWQNKNYFIL